MSKLTGEKVIYSAKADSDISFEYALPEYLPGVSRIVKTGVCTQQCSFSGDGEIAQIRIPLKISIIYISEYDGKIKSCSFREDITLPLDEAFTFEGEHFAVPSCSTSAVQGRILSQRKIAVKAYLSAGVLVYAKNEAELYSPDENEAVFTKELTLPVCRKKVIPDTSFENEAEIVIPDGKAVGEIIYTDVKCAQISAKVSEGQVDFEAQAYMHILYETPFDDEDEQQSSTYAFLDTAVTLTDTIHLDKVNADDTAFVCIDVYSVEPSLSYDSYGENKSLLLTIKYSVSGFLYECGKEALVTDAFSENSFAEPEFTETVVENILSPISKKEHISQLVHTPVGEVSEIAAVKAKIQVVSIEQSEGKFTASAKCRMELLGTNVSGELYSVDAPIVLRVPVADKDMHSPEAVPEIILGISDCASRIKDGGLEIDFDVDIDGVMVNKTSVSVVKSLNTADSEKKAAKSNEIIIYYPKNGEKLWDIAQKYRVSPEKLCLVNNIEEKDFAKKHTVIIP